MPVTITEPGLYAMDATDYHADPVPGWSLSSSGARKIIATCPALYLHEREKGSPDSQAMEFGRMAHALVLEGKSVEDAYHIVPDGFVEHHTTKWAETLAEIAQSGKPWLKKGAAETVNAMKEALEAHEFAGAAFENGRPETSAFWQDRDSGIWCRARFDYLPRSGRIVPDYKTCTSAAPDALQRTIVTYGYHQQAAWYLDGLHALGLIERPIFMFVFQEKTPPYLVTCATIDSVSLVWGEQLNQKAKATFAECRRTGRWPGYADDIITLSLPPWEEKRLEAMAEAGELTPEWSEAA